MSELRKSWHCNDFTRDNTISEFLRSFVVKRVFYINIRCFIITVLSV